MPTLFVRDKNGNFVPIPAIRGEDGKSAYEQAVEGGFQGSEEEFIALLGSLANNAINALSDDSEIMDLLNAHISSTGNPHQTKAEDINALPTSGGTIQGDVNIHNSNHPSLKVGVDGNNTLNLFYTQNKTVDLYNWTNGEPTTISLGNVNSMLLRDVCKLWVGAKDYQIYGDHNAEALGIGKIATGTYVGTGTGGAANPTILTFPFPPKVVFISIEGKTDRCDATLPLVHGSRIGLVYSATSSNWSTHSTYPLNLVWEGNTLAMTYTLNSTSVDQRQLNISDATYKWVIWG